MRLTMGADEIGESPEPPDGIDFLAALAQGSNPTPQQFQYVESPQYVEDTVGGEVDAQMAEAERRLKKAVLYRTVIQGGLFDQGGEAGLTAEVEQEFAVFARQRLAELLGVGSSAKPTSPAEQLFTPQQVVVLRTLADAVTANRHISGKLGVQADKAAAPVQPAAPTLKRRTVAAQPPVQQRKQQQQEVAPTPQRPAPMVQRRDPNAIPSSESVIQRGNARYKINWIPIDPEEYGSAAEPVISGLQPGQRQKLPNGITVFMPEDGSGPFKLVERKITTQARTGKSAPFPNPQAMAAVTAMQAGQADQLARSGSPGLNMAIVTAQKS